MTIYKRSFWDIEAASAQSIDLLKFRHAPDRRQYSEYPGLRELHWHIINAVIDRESFFGGDVGMLMLHDVCSTLADREHL